MTPHTPHPLLDAAIDSAADAVFITNARGEIEYANRVFEAMSGYAADEVVGRNVSVLASGEHDETFFEALWSTVASGRVYRGRIENRRRDGALYEVDTTITPLRDPDSGEITHYLAFQRDVTRASAIQDDREEMDRLESLGRLAGGMAHAMNNMLAVIRAGSDLALVDAPQGTALQKQLLEINNAASSAAELTRHLLAFGRRQTMQLHVVDVGELCERMRTVLSRVVGSGIDLVLDVRPGLWPVRMDARQLEYAIVSLAVNARRAMPSGGTFTVTTENRTIQEGEHVVEGGLIGAGDYVMVTVSDTGHGMDRETRRRAFEPFFSTKVGAESAGLGLSTVYGIVSQSGGRVGLSSAPGEGTSVRLYLPKATTVEPLSEGGDVAGAAAPSGASADGAVDGGAVAGAETKGGEVAGAAAEGETITDPPASEEARLAGSPRAPIAAVAAPGTILIVEDYAAVRRAAQRSLERVGYTVLTAEDEAEALRVSEEHSGPIDLVLSDVMLGEDRGPEVVALLRKTHPDIRVLFMSGYVGDDGRAQIPPDAPFIPKPFSFESLCQAVEDALKAPAWVG